jgi:hypothetical protein
MAESVWDSEFVKKCKMRQIVALCGISLAGGTSAAFGGKGWLIAAPTPLPATIFHQQTRVVEHKGGMRLCVFFVDLW